MHWNWLQSLIVVINGSNHWILHHPDQVIKTETMVRGTEVLFLWQPVIASPAVQQRLEEPQTVVSS